MNKQRLSDLQKWILKKCYAELYIFRNEAREYYNKKFSPSYKSYNKSVNNKEFISTKAIEAAISRSFKLLINNGLLTKFEKCGAHYLTEKGFLKVNNYVDADIFVNFKEYEKKYLKRIEHEKRKKEQEHIELQKHFGIHSEEYKVKIQKLNKLQFLYEKRFTIDKIHKIVCNKCKQKINEYQIKCGINKINTLKQKIEE